MFSDLILYKNSEKKNPIVFLKKQYTVIQQKNFICIFFKKVDFP